MRSYSQISPDQHSPYYTLCTNPSTRNISTMHSATMIKAFAIAALAGSSVAAPAATNTSYQWSITKWSFCRGQSAYDYSFTVKGGVNGDTPAFKATCSGTQQGGYKACDVTSGDAVYVSANVNIVVDPNNPNDSIPRVFVKTNYVDAESCRYTSIGHHDATGNCGATTGRKFSIEPKDTAVC